MNQTKPHADDLTDRELIDSSGLGDVAGFHLRLAQGAVFRHFSETFAQLGLTQKQISIMLLVHRCGTLGQSRVAGVLQMDRATTTALVNRLQKDGLLDRQPDPSDGRKFDLVLTKRGAAVLTSAEDAIVAHEKWLRARYTAAEADTLIALLSRLHSAP